MLTRTAPLVGVFFYIRSEFMHRIRIRNNSSTSSTGGGWYRAMDGTFYRYTTNTYSPPKPKKNRELLHLLKKEG